MPTGVPDTGSAQLQRLAELLLISARVARALADGREDGDREAIFRLADQTTAIAMQMRGIATRDGPEIGLASI